MKFFILCEAESGYISDFLIYADDGTVHNPKYNQYPVSTKIILHLMDWFLGKGYSVTTDNFYVSPHLIDILVTWWNCCLWKRESYGPEVAGQEECLPYECYSWCKLLFGNMQI